MEANRGSRADSQEPPDLWRALALSRAEARVSQTNLLASEAALASSRAETQAGLTELLASAVALASSQTETRIGLAELLTSAAALSASLTEKRDLATQLAQAQKMQALGQLAAGIAHDFNNILQVVSGAAALIERRPGDLEQTRRLARSAASAADRGMSITQRLLSFARHGELRAEAIATADLVQDLCNLLAHTLGTTITIRAEIEPGVPALIADRAQLETAMINLGVNSRDAMPGGGLLIISAKTEHIGEGLQHSAGLVAGDYIRLAVSDNGAGMDAATLARVSEPFFTTKPQGKGTGLGVAMARGFAEQSGGGLAIASTPGAGTTVMMWLRQTTGVILRTEIEDHEHKPALPSAYVLVVDDDDLVREILAAQLEDEGFNVLTAASGQEALASIEADDRVGILVSDYSMPGMDGMTTIRRALTMRPTLNCFLLTGYVGNEALAVLSTGKPFVVIRKPTTGISLAGQIAAAVEGNRGTL